MRQSKKEIRDPRIILNLLDRCQVGRLGTIGEDGYPRIKPLNFVCFEGDIYFHTALEGEKIQDIARDNRVCFELDLPIAYVSSRGEPCLADYDFRSIIIRGRATLIEDHAKKIAVLSCLMAKYQPEGGYDGYFRKLAITGVVRIAIEELTGKENFFQQNSNF